MDQYNKICDYLQEAVNMGTMTEEDAAVFESMAAEKYDVKGEVVEESVEDSDFDLVTVDSSYFEAVLDEMLELYEAADTTNEATLKSYIAGYKELAGTYKNNVKSAKKLVKAGNYSEAKKQLNDGKKALAKLRVTTVAYKDSIPGTVVATLTHALYIGDTYRGIVAALTGVAALATAAKKNKDLDKDTKTAVVAAGAGAAIGGSLKVATNLCMNDQFIKDMKGAKTNDLGKQNLLVAISKAEKAIEKVEKLIEKKEAKSK